MRLFYLAAALALCTVTAAATAGPCNGVDRRLSKDDITSLTRRMTEQFHDDANRPVQSFKFNGWSIIYVEFSNSDPGFVFYRGDPIHTPYVTVWGGGAGYNEESEIRVWTLKNAPGIPARLAACFAWYATKGRDM